MVETAGISLCTHVSREEEGSFDEGAAEEEEIPETGATQVTENTQNKTNH